MLEANVNQLESELITAMLEIDRADYKFEMLVRCYFKTVTSIKSPTILSPTSLSPSNNITFVFKTKVNKTFYPNETTQRWNNFNWHKLRPIYNNQIPLEWDLRDSGSQFDILKCLFSVKITLYQIHIIIYDQLVTFFGIKGPLNTKMTSK